VALSFALACLIVGSWVGSMSYLAASNYELRKELGSLKAIAKARRCKLH